MVKNDRWIRRMAREKGMIEPFEPGQVSGGVVSFGTSSYGYDLRIADEFQLPEASDGVEIDPKTAAPMREEKCDSIVLRPGAYLLARSLEYFRIPRGVLALCFGKSTYARCGVVVNITPLEPEWEGFITIAINNCGAAPVRLHSNEGIAQVVFIAAEEACETSYADRKGKYQRQKGIKTAFVRGDNK
ncbi:MAG: dCTP deaminase [bacterium]